MISGAKLERFRGWKVGKIGGKLDPQVTKQIHGSNSTKHHQINKSRKKLRLFLVGISKFRTNSNKIRLENGGGDSKFVINMAHDTKMM